MSPPPPPQVQSGGASSDGGGTNKTGNRRGAGGGKGGKKGNKKRGGGGGSKGGAGKNAKEGPTAGLLELRRSPESPAVLVGRNNLQNERITFSLARAHELWLHARGVAGAHVLLRLVSSGEKRGQEEAGSGGDEGRKSARFGVVGWRKDRVFVLWGWPGREK